MSGSFLCNLQIDNDVEDRISQLPNEVLLDILSLLTFKEAAKSSVLAKRWRDLWKSTSRLIFDGSKAQDKLIRTSYDAIRGEEQYLESSKFVRWVNQVVRSHEGPSIDQFTIKFGLDPRSADDIDEWIKFMVQKRAKNVEIDFYPFYFGEFYTISQDRCNYIKSVSNISFGMCLKSLSLRRVNVDDVLLDYFLSNCPNLEMLSVSMSKHLVNLKVGVHSLRLKCLQVERCKFLESIELCAPKLVTFSYFGHKVKFVLGSNPLLTEFNIGGGRDEEVTYALVAFSSHLSQLEKLSINMVVERCGLQLPQFGELSNLKHLTLRLTLMGDVRLIGCSTFIVGAPSLLKFTLKLRPYYPVEPYMREVLVEPHPCLKEVEILGYVGGYVLELAMYLVKNAVNLEKMVIDPWNRDEVIARPRDLGKRMKRLQKDAEVLKRILPADGGELVIVNY